MRYVVKPGDTLYQIAKQFNTTVDNILAANPQIKDPNFIVPGEIIQIPKGLKPPRPPKPPCPVLQLGSRGRAVVELQTLLTAAGFSPGPIDGIFGPRTRAAVLAFQKSKNITQDGIVGPETWRALGVPC